ncbi:IclR family transcriptional regulator [bacterium]|nr:IclR family transcriptional regulator [bacterium]
MAPTYHLVQSLVKSLAIMEILGESVEGLGVTEIGDRVGMNKSTVHRILTTLVHEGYVDQDQAKGRYRLSFKMFVIARKILNNIRATKVVSPFLEKLAGETEESARFVVPDMEHARLIVCDEVLTKKSIGVRPHLGDSLSLSKSAAGKMFLASLSDDQIKLLMDEKGRKTVIEDDGYSFSSLRKDLGQVRDQGIAYDVRKDELESTINIAAPIRDENGELVGMLDLYAPKFRAEKNFDKKYGKLVNDTALEISKKLGYIPA